MARNNTSAAAAIVLLLGVVGCAQEKTDTAVAGVAPASAPLGDVRKLAVTQVPLPPGEWVELARGARDFRMINENRSNGTDWIEVAYGQIENGRISAFLHVRSNSETKPGTNWILGGFCTAITDRQQNEVFLQKVDSVEINRASCLKVKYTRMDAPKGTSLYADAWNAAKRYGGFPRDAIDVGYESNFNGNALDYRMFYFPERGGLPQGRWVTGGLDPAREKYLQSLVAWAQGFQHWVIDGTKNSL